MTTPTAPPALYPTALRLTPHAREALLDHRVYGHRIAYAAPDDPRRPDGSPVPAYESDGGAALALAADFARLHEMAVTMTVHPDGEALAMVLWTTTGQPAGGCFNVPTLAQAICMALLSYFDNLDAGRLQRAIEALRENRPPAND